jgi:hypothetical protein
MVFRRFCHQAAPWGAGLSADFCVNLNVPLSHKGNQADPHSLPDRPLFIGPSLYRVESLGPQRRKYDAPLRIHGQLSTWQLILEKLLKLQNFLFDNCNLQLYKTPMPSA